MDAEREMRATRNAVIDLEVEAKRIQAEMQRVADLRVKEVRRAEEKMEDLAMEVEQIEKQKIAFRREIQQVEHELKIK